MKALRLIIIFVIFILSISCNNQNEFDVNIDDFSLIELKDSNLVFEANIEIYNPKIFKINIVGYNSDISYQNIVFANSNSGSKICLKPKRKNKSKFKLELNLSKFKPVFADFVNNDSIKININSDFFIRGIFKKHKINKKTNVYINLKDELLKQFNTISNKTSPFVIKDIKPQKLKLKNTTFKVDALITNTFPIEFNISNVNLDIFINKNMDIIGNIKSNTLYTINAYSKSKISFFADIDNINTISSMKDVLFGDEKHYILKGKVEIEIAGSKFLIPVDYKQKIN